MSDVVYYAALKENARLNQEYLELRTSSSSAIGLSYYSTPQTGGYPYVTSSTVLPTCPQVMRDWLTNLTPLVLTGSTGFKVCDASGNFRCNACCQFCVPPGVCRVQFQLWGPGGGTSTNCCCGGAPFGPSGAYSVVQLDVTPGNCYTLCSGCGVCCFATQTTPGGQGSTSWVCGPGLFICATGGIPCYCCWNADIQSGTCGCAIPAVGAGGTDGCAAHGCSGWNWCWDTAADNTSVCHAFSSSATWALPCAGTGRNLVCYGINGLWPHVYIGTSNNNACTVSTPVFGFESCILTENFSSGVTCAGCCRSGANGFLQIPGAGGHASTVFGGCQACGGDYGRMGMICVSYGF